MKIFTPINLTNTYQNNTARQNKSYQTYHALMPTTQLQFNLSGAYFLPQLHFRAMSKKDYEGTDLACIEKFKAPIEKFSKTNDLQQWAMKKLKADYLEKDFGGRQKETQIQRKAMLKEWSNYVIHDNDAYNNATSLLIMNAVLKDLKPDNDNLPPVLNRGILADTINEISDNLKIDQKYSFDMNKMYKNKLRAYYMEDTSTGETGTKWIKIPSKEHDPENFEKNVDKLKMLSHKNWCTKSFNAKPYLAKGDFCVYLENGDPKIGIRFVDDKIQEIQGEQNNSKIPIKYLDETERYLKENDFQCLYKAKNEITNAHVIKEKLKTVTKDLGEDIKNNNVANILKYFGVKFEKNKEDNLLTIDEFKEPSTDYNFEDVGINEDNLFEQIGQINSSVNFQNIQITNLGKLHTIVGDASFESSKVKDLGKLDTIRGNAIFTGSKITNLNQLQKIGRDAIFTDSKVSDLGQLQNIGGNAVFTNSDVINLGQLQKIGGNATFTKTDVNNIGQLQTIGGNAIFTDSKITNLNQLQKIGKDAIFTDSKVSDLGNLQTIGRDALFINSNITNIGKLNKIGRDALFQNLAINSLNNLEYIGQDARLKNSQISDIGNLKYIGKDIYLNKLIKPKDLENVQINGKIHHS